MATIHGVLGPIDTARPRLHPDARARHGRELGDAAGLPRLARPRRARRARHGGGPRGARSAACARSSISRPSTSGATSP